MTTACLVHARLFIAFAVFAALAALLGFAPQATRPAVPPPATGTAPSTPPAPGPAPGTTQPQEKLVYVQINTNKGDIVLELNREKAPVSVENFVAYVNKKHYDGTVFHRVIPNFMIQGGGFTPQGQQKPTAKGIKNEWQNGLKNTRGAIAMARIGGDPNSGTSQFFINHVDNAALDQRQADGAAYAVFGKVIAGMNVVDAIAATPTTVRNGMRDWPVEDVIMQSVKTISADEAKKLAGASGAPAATKPATPQLGR